MTNAAVAYAAAQLGKPYVFGAAGPGSFDCSGLTMRAWQACGITLPHFTVAQYAAVSHRPIGQAQPGDLVFWNDGGWIHHVALYIGGGQIIEAPDVGIPVRVRSISATETGIMANVGALPAQAQQTAGGAVAAPALSWSKIGGVAGGIAGSLIGGAAGVPGAGGVAGGAIGGTAPGVGGAIVGNLGSLGVSGAVMPFILKTTFVLGGITLAVVGLWKTTDAGHKIAAAADSLPLPLTG